MRGVSSAPATGVAIWTYAAAARRLGVSRQRVGQLAHAGRLQRITMDGRDYVSAASVLERLREQAAARARGGR